MNLRAENLHFAYAPGQPVLRDVSLHLRAGHVTAIFGPNGCGKSTLLRCLNGAISPQQGTVWLDEQPINRLDRRRIARAVAVVPQDTPSEVPFRVGQVVMLGRYPHSGGWEPTDADRQAVSSAMNRLGIMHLADRRFGQLSGGERQRVVIARALAQETPILLLDEPAAHLDIAHQLELYRLLQQLAAEGKSICAIYHDLVFPPLFTHTTVLMHAGQILAQGNAPEVLSAANLQSAYQVHLHLTRPTPATITIILPPT